MKKLFVYTLILLLAPAAFAKWPGNNDMDQALEKAILSANSHEKGVIPVTFDVMAEFDELYAKPNYLTKKCVAVRISDEYLLASLACRGAKDTATKHTSLGSAGSEAVKNAKLAYRRVTGATVAGEEIPSKNIVEDEKSRLILIRLDINKDQMNNRNLQDVLQDVPMPNLFIPKDPKSLLDTFPTVMVNRNRMPNTGRTCAKVSVKEVCSDKGCFKVCWKPISAQTGSPLFGLQDNSEQEFLLGFNAAEPDGESRTSGEEYFLLTEDTVPFLQKNMTPSAFAKVKKKIVDEEYFK